jgi:multiple antibiotic resistance protein
MAKILGTNGMQIVSRTMGLILCAIAVQFVIDGLAQLLPGVLNPIYTQGLG